MDDFAKTVSECDDEDFQVECVGVLGNMVLPDLDYSQILQTNNLIPWIRKILVPGNIKLLKYYVADNKCSLFP